MADTVCKAPKTFDRRLCIYSIWSIANSSSVHKREKILGETYESHTTKIIGLLMYLLLAQY